MSTLSQAHDELFRRTPDECFSSVESLIQHCRNEHRESQDRWHLPARLQPTVVGGELSFSAGDDGEFLLNDWSFSQICRPRVGALSRWMMQENASTTSQTRLTGRKFETCSSTFSPGRAISPRFFAIRGRMKRFVSTKFGMTRTSRSRWNSRCVVSASACETGGPPAYLRLRSISSK